MSEDTENEDLDGVRTTYARATAGYDEEFELALQSAISLAILKASVCTDVNALMVRTGETAEALITMLACVLALSPAATRTPKAIRETVDDLGRRLRRKVAAAERSPDVMDFLARAFHGGRTEGNA